jgi:hypothetical protein
MRIPSGLTIGFLALACSAIPCAAQTRLGSDWPAVVPEELALKDNPAEPGAKAMFLYREAIVNNNKETEEIYNRIKIFTEEGRKLGDVEISYSNIQEIKDVRARTIHPDGTTTEFDGHVLDKLLVKSGDIKVQAKTFSLPDVTPGCIIEYRYRVQYSPDLLLSSTWFIQDALYTKHAHFVFVPRSPMPLYHSLVIRNFRENVKPEKQKDGSYTLDVNDITGVPEEDYMLPVEELRGRVEFLYTLQNVTNNPKDFWDAYAKARAAEYDSYVGNRDAIKQEASKTVNPDDSPEVKLRKLYARAQQIHNTVYDPAKTAQEAGRDKTKDNKNIEDVMKHGYGTTVQIDLFFVGLAQAEGFNAALILDAPRNHRIFHPELEDTNELTDEVVLVRAQGKDYFLAPSVPICPFGMMPWGDTANSGMLVTNGGATFVKIPVMSSSDNVVERHAQLKLDENGSLTGTITVKYTGERAYLRRYDAMHEEQAGKDKQMTDEIHTMFPPAARFQLSQVSGWDQIEQPIEVQGTIRLPGMAESAGRRLLLPAGLYESGKRQRFDPTERKQDVYFAYPFEDVDDITIQLPPGWKVEALPKNPPLDPGGQLHYDLTATQDGDTIHLHRNLTVGALLYPVSSYPALRHFFGQAKEGDDQELVLQKTDVAAAHN